jgi:SAM-dependent methyltransferase
MLSAAVRNLFARFSHHAPEEVVEQEVLTGLKADPEPVDSKIEPAADTAWSLGRLALAHRLWGSGYIFPGGESETLRLARPLGASDDTSLLIVGIGSGGPANAVARDMGTWITGLESDPLLLSAAKKRFARSRFAKKVNLQPWDPHNPAFVPKSHHHCLALNPLLCGQPEPILDGMARALKPGGQLVLTELTSTASLDRPNPIVSRWSALEHRDPVQVPVGIAVTRMLGRIGLEVRVAEDISKRHMEQTMLGWRMLLRELRDRKPTTQEAAYLVSEAELWLLRRRLIREGRLRMMRWHAMSRVPIV